MEHLSPQASQSSSQLDRQGNYPSCGVEFRPLRIDLGPDLPRYVQVLQVQPADIEFRGSDYRARAELLSAVFSFLSSGGAVEAYHGEPTEQVEHPPQVPWLALFPELYCPAYLLLDSLAPMLAEPGQSVLTGLSPLAADRPVPNPLFDLSELIRLRTRLVGDGSIDFLNPETLDALIGEARRTDQSANLAATIARNGTGNLSLVLHAKVSPSYEERRPTPEECTLGAPYAHPIELCANPAFELHVLPLICSDFIMPTHYQHPSGKETMLHLWSARQHAQDRMDLLCVINVEKIASTVCPVWPPLVCAQLQQKAIGGLGEVLRKAHVALTNVGGRDGAPIGGGTSFVVQSYEEARSVERHMDWAKGFGKVHFWGQTTHGMQWYDDRTAALAPPLLTQIFMAPSPAPSRGLVRQFQFYPGELGQRSIAAAKMYVINDKVRRIK